MSYGESFRVTQRWRVSLTGGGVVLAFRAGEAPVHPLGSREIAVRPGRAPDAFRGTDRVGVETRGVAAQVDIENKGQKQGIIYSFKS